MTAFVALLRGINVGTAKRVPMAELRALLTALKHERVATLLNSGNAVFHASTGTAAQHAAAISAALAKRFGFDVPVVVKTVPDLDAVIRDNPLARAAFEPSRLLVIFSQTPAGLTTIAHVADLVVAPERFHLGAHAGYLYCAPGISNSKAAAGLLGKAGAAITTRNWATVLKLQALAAPMPTR